MIYVTSLLTLLRRAGPLSTIRGADVGLSKARKPESRGLYLTGLGRLTHICRFATTTTFSRVPTAKCELYTLPPCAENILHLRRRHIRSPPNPIAIAIATATFHSRPLALSTTEDIGASHVAAASEEHRPHSLSPDQ